jgi:hypothetical protein
VLSDKGLDGVAVKFSARLDRGEDMSVHVATCTSCDCNARTPVVWKLWPW